MSKRHLYVLCGVLLALGAGIMLYRHLVLGFPLLPDRARETWRIEVRLTFDAVGRPAKATMMLPTGERGTTIVQHSFVAPGFGVTTSSQGSNRRAIFSTGHAEGPQVVYYQAVIHRGARRGTPARVSEPALQPVRYQGIQLAAAEAINTAVEAASADVETYVRLLVSRLKQAKEGSEEALLLGREPTSRRLAAVAVDVLALARIPARAVHGLALEPDRRRAPFGHWIEVWHDDAWHPFDTTAGEFRTPPGHLTWWRGNARLVTLEGGRNPRTQVAVRHLFEYAMHTAITGIRLQSDLVGDLSLVELPLATQEVYRNLLAVPIGILLLVILRNVVGLSTFGTFMPVLIALAFRSTELAWGIVLFTIVLGLGLSIRFYLERLKLLLVPRIASIVIVVIGIMALLSIASQKLGFERGLSVALFPIVILSMTIERMTVVWDERGARDALIQAGGSLLAASLCYLLMNVQVIRHIVFVFPETLFIILACCLLLGRYSGYRLVELPRFRVLAKPGS